MGSSVEDDSRSNQQCAIDSERYRVYGHFIATKHIHHMGSRNRRNIPQFHHMERFKGRCDGSQMEFQCHIESSCCICGWRNSNWSLIESIFVFQVMHGVSRCLYLVTRSNRFLAGSVIKMMNTQVTAISQNDYYHSALIFVCDCRQRYDCHG